MHKKIVIFFSLAFLILSHSVNANTFTDYLKKFTKTVAIVAPIATATIIAKTAYDDYQKDLESNCLPTDFGNTNNSIATFNYYISHAAQKTWQATQSKAQQLQTFLIHEWNILMQPDMPKDHHNLEEAEITNPNSFTNLQEDRKD